jgi:beta-N-acetylhexosaminidase
MADGTRRFSRGRLLRGLRTQRRLVVLAAIVALCICALSGSLLLARQLVTTSSPFSGRPAASPSERVSGASTPAPSAAGGASLALREDPDDRLSLSQLVGQMVMSGMAGTQPDESTLRSVREGEVGGILLFSENVGPALPSGMRLLQQTAAEGHNPPLLIATDQEGGTVRRLPGPPKSPRLMASEADARSQGEATAALLLSNHVTVNLAPVADVTSEHAFEAVQGRGFAGDPPTVAALADAFAQGLQARGVAATAKHFPGIGSLSVDTDHALGRVNSSGAELEQQILPFKQLVHDGVDMVMLANAVYAGLDGANPAVFSPKVVQVLRQELGFRGVVITDDLNAASLSGEVGNRAVQSVSAGADIVLYGSPEGGRAAYRALLAAAESGQLSRSRLLESHERLVALKAKLDLVNQ